MGEVRFLVALLLFVACTPHVDRARWQQMPQSEKVLYVKSLLGAEKVKEAKGGHARHYSHPAEDYVKRIDAAYARGDARDPGEILAGLRDRGLSSRAAKTARDPLASTLSVLARGFLATLGMTENSRASLSFRA